MTLRQKGSRRRAQALIGAQRNAWTTLMQELEEFIRKNDYRFREEAMTQQEETSWTRVLDVVVGLQPHKLKARDPVNRESDDVRSDRD
jgi:hypothetical protein